jgi:UDP-N-acetylglucosamine 2-epimerase (non-hydrolysing)
MKVAPVLRALRALDHPFRPLVVHTGQHYDPDMSDVFLRQLGVTGIDAFLEAGSGSHAVQTARVLESFERYLMEVRQQVRGTVVVGDVNSTLAAALAAVKLGIPVAHIEAGLRSGDRTMPEEINRILTDAMAELLLVSEPSGLENLKREGITGHKVVYTGNVMLDTLAAHLPAARDRDMAGRLGFKPGAFALATLHRPNNVDGQVQLGRVVRFLKRVGAVLPVIFPVHPRTRARLQEYGLWGDLQSDGHVLAMAPLGYEENLSLMAGARVVLTDSGGIQEETTYLGVPCLTLRPNTERPVTVTHGTNMLVGEDLDLAERLIERIRAGHYKTAKPIDGWDGKAAERIVSALIRAWGSSGTPGGVRAEPDSLRVVPRSRS